MDIEDANLREAVLTGCRFRHSVLAGADLRGADLYDAYFRQADLQEVDWDGAAVGGAVFESCKLDDAGRGYLVEHGATIG